MANDTDNTKTAPALTAAAGSEMHAGEVAPSPKRYTVTFPHDHDTLNRGDVVMMVQAPGSENFFLRESDRTIHALKDYLEQYVHVVEIPPNNKD